MATYGSEAGVEGINAHIASGYSSSTTPTSTQVGTYLSDGYAYLNAALAKAGYSTPVSATATCYAVLARLNNLFAAATAEEAVNISASGLDTEMRSARLWARFREELGEFMAGDMTLAGLSRSGSAPVRKRVRSLPMRHYDGYAINADETDDADY